MPRGTLISSCMISPMVLPCGSTLLTISLTIQPRDIAVKLEEKQQPKNKLDTKTDYHEYNKTTVKPVLKQQLNSFITKLFILTVVISPISI